MRRKLTILVWALVLVVGLGIAGQQDMQAELARIEGIGNGNS